MSIFFKNQLLLETTVYIKTESSWSVKYLKICILDAILCLWFLRTDHDTVEMSFETLEDNLKHI